MNSQLDSVNARPRWATVRLACAFLVAGVFSGGVARAQLRFGNDSANVELFGVLDGGLAYLQHSWAGSDVLASTINSYNLNASRNSFTGLYSGGISMSRVGLRGEADVGDGRKVFFRLETAINVTTGDLSNNGQAIYNNVNVLRTANSASAIDGQWYSRAAYLGFSDPAWGSVQAGRTPNFSLEQVVEYDPLQAALLYSPLGYSGGIGGGLGATENTRLDNSIKYEYKLSGINVGLQYKLAGDKNSQAAGHGWVGMLGYEAGAVSFKGTYSQTTNSVAWPVQYSNVVKPGANLQIEDTKGYMLTGMYKVAAATVKVGYEYLQILPPSNPNLTSIQNYFGINVPKPAVNATGEQRYEVFWVGGDYKFTPEFDLGVGFYDIGTYNEPEIGKAYWAQAYSLLADYTFTKKFDAYIGVTVMQYSGVGLANKAPVIAYSNNGLYGVGLRYRF